MDRAGSLGCGTAAAGRGPVMGLRPMQGFTLIEVMIVTAIIAIVMAIAVPSYQNHVETTRRGDAQGAMVGLANALERYYVDNRTYAGADAGTIYAAKSPIDGSETYYELSITNATRRDYTIRAVPKNAQSKDPCGTLTLDRSGQRDVVGASRSADDCWRG